MSLRTLTEIKLPIGASEKELLQIAQKKLGKPPAYFAIKKKSIDARDKNNLRFVYTIAFSSAPQTVVEKVYPRLPKNKLPSTPVLVVGTGPAGLFCAIRLIEHGVTPIVVERGAPVDEREETINRFFTQKTLDFNSNVQFGEGGAGTFSDGKLNTQTHSPLIADVLETFVKFGAPEEILWLNKPHIGSDNLKKVVKNMREYIVQKGGEVRFYTQLDDIKIENGVVKKAVLRNVQTNVTCDLDVSAVVLAIGHSARDTFETLLKRGVQMQSKEFAVGVRIEHLQADIGKAQYGDCYKKLPPADYKLTYHDENRSAFTFCMCPGGYVMPATSEQDCVVTNGMSNYARDGENANSALIAQVKKSDFSADHPLAGVEYQRALERLAFQTGGGNYVAPIQLVGDFLKDKESSRFGEISPTYATGTRFADLRAVLPAPIVTTLKGAILQMDKRLRGFARADAILTGVETRTSSPVRIERDGETLQSANIVRLYPCGEGAGYAGGITSSAVDGLRVATAIFAEFSK